MAFPFRVAQRFDFRVRPARPAMPALPNDFALLYQHGADHRIRRGRAVATPGEAESPAHEVVCVIMHNRFQALL